MESRLGGEVAFYGRVPTLHVYLDESGDLNFTPTGTRYYVFAVGWTYDPAPIAHDLTNLRFSLLKCGVDLHSFHAAEDKQAHRNAVISRIAAQPNWNFCAIVVEKCRANPSVRELHYFYPKFAGMALRFVFKRFVNADTNYVLVFTDSLPIRKHKDAITKAFKQSARSDLPRGLRFDVYHHPRPSNKWLQAVDYCCWAVFRKWELGDRRTYDQLKGRLIKSELDVFHLGDQTKYY